MCRSASMYVTRTEVLIGTTDNHTVIAREHNIRDVLPGLKELPELPSVTDLSCRGCTGLNRRMNKG